jgi:hypothetical protein
MKFAQKLLHCWRGAAGAGFVLSQCRAKNQRQRARHFLRDQTGATAVVVAIAAPALLGMSALGIDVGL